MVNIKSMIKIIKYNARILFGVNTIVAALFVGAMPFVFSLNNIEYSQIAKIAELYLPIIGIILLSYITSIERNNLIEEFSYTKKFRFNYIFLIRFFINTMLISFLLAVLFLYAKYQGGIFPFHKVFIGCLVTTIYLGFLALTAYNLTKNLSVGYMIAFSYYFFEFSTKGKYTKELYLFSLLKDSFSEKIYLAIGGIILLIVNVILIKYHGENL
ncbi:hypothetical protein [Clostridium grantii]|uniref:ABC-2 family transporter protein n=1 Tax=Clostridium grantii DSM 8605 TaxID=1121316 RepID=A0A1M5WTR9_9CLOT|nr:hypothetical protein [Clostridium grantii]SHH90860.1 hypothetical protein SAMN02745207_03115 [Clostridium grantii DSM 8605]